MVVDKVKIEKEAKQLLDKFAKSLERVEEEELAESFVERPNFERDENGSENIDPSFKERILKNAANKDHDFIIAEKGSWK